MRAIAVLVLCVGLAVSADEAQTSISTVASADGTPIAIECAGANCPVTSSHICGSLP